MTRQTWILASLAAVLVVVAYFFLLHRPRSDELAEVRAEIEQVLQQQAQATRRIEELEQVRAEAPEIEAQLAAAEAIVPRDPALPATLRQLQLAADDSGVELRTVSPSRPAASGIEEAPPELARIALAVTLEGGYFQVVDFLRRIEDPEIIPRGIVWESAAVSVADYPTLTANLSGHMFALLPTGATAAPEAAPSPSPDGQEPATENGGGGA